MKIKRMDLIFVIILGIITIISIDFILNESHRAFIENIASIPPFQDIASGIYYQFPPLIHLWFALARCHSFT